MAAISYPTTVTQAVEANPIETAFSSQIPFDVLFGVAIGNDYVSRGVTSSNSRPAVQAYIEPHLGLAYLNIWSSNVDYGEGFDGATINVQAGAKRWYDSNPFWFDIGYVHYFFSPQEITPDYGEIFAKAKYVFGDFALGAETDFAPDISQSGKTATYVEGNALYYFSEQFWMSGGVGYQFSQYPALQEYLTWNAGVSYTWKAVTFDLRYSDTTLSGDECVFYTGFADGCDARVVGTIYVDTALSKLSHADH